MVSSLNTKNSSGTSLKNYNYSYDDVGNITNITGSTNATYTYDEQGQLLSETEGEITTTYSYDGAGNIVSVDDGYETHSYTYGNSDWGDLLTAYDGYTISYDEIGNPTTWYDMSTFTWEQGRRLASAENIYTGLSNSYTYDADGLRLSKTVGDVEHKYVWQGGKLVSEYFGGKELEFFYDESGSPYAFSYKTSANAIPSYYYYVTNLQGDVVSILDANGTEKASYSYNAWGKILSATGDMAFVNPLRYRGYYYDDETGFYYLKGRYYDPQIQRFINADGLASTGQGILGTNMFAYCLNNPINYTDSEGAFALLAAIPITAALATFAYYFVVTTVVTAAALFAVYIVNVTCDYISDAVVQAKRSKAPTSNKGVIDSGGGAASPTPPGNGNRNNRGNGKRNGDRPTSPKKVGDNVIDRINSHQFKNDVIKGQKLPKSVSKYDIYVDKANGEIWLLIKQSGKWIPTYETITTLLENY